MRNYNFIGFSVSQFSDTWYVGTNSSTGSGDLGRGLLIGMRRKPAV